MLQRLIVVLFLSLVLLPTVALANGTLDRDQNQEEWLLYSGAIESADSSDVVREIDGAAGQSAVVENGDGGVTR